MANHKPVEVDAKQLQDAKDLWTKFTVGTKYAVVATAATLVLIMLLIVDFS